MSEEFDENDVASRDDSRKNGYRKNGYHRRDKRHRPRGRGRTQFHHTPMFSTNLNLDIRNETFAILKDESEVQGVTVFAFIRDLLDGCAAELSSRGTDRTDD